MSDEAKIRVLVVDDNADTISNLKKLLYFEKDIEVVGTGGSGDAAVTLAKEQHPDLVLMDINMPGIGGIEATRLITAQAGAPVVLLCSTYQRADLPADAQDSGAAAYVHKEELSADLLRRLWAEHRPAPVGD